MIRVRLVAGDIDELQTAADRIADVLTVVSRARSPQQRRDGRGYSLYLRAELLAGPDVDTPTARQR